MMDFFTIFPGQDTRLLEAVRKGCTARQARIYPLPPTIRASPGAIIGRFCDKFTTPTCVTRQRGSCHYAIAATFARRQTAIPADLPDALTTAFAEDSLKRRQWTAFAADLDNAPKQRQPSSTTWQNSSWMQQPQRAIMKPNSNGINPNPPLRVSPRARKPFGRCEGGLTKAASYVIPICWITAEYRKP
ncbi:MAG: hypothetical protein J2P53_00460 [Bradyrhizobiaceae bacterium]|nr:hypothetical protein [Bradyrhizobiaceae bacterium]